MAQIGAIAPLVLVTGAAGFVGTALCAALPGVGFRVRRVVRAQTAPSRDELIVGDIGEATDWKDALQGVDCVVHLAARTHVLHDTARDPLREYWRINVAGTRRLAEQACEAGVRRFVFLSSVKVNGEATRGEPFRESDVPRPEDPYGITKLEAERTLADIATRSSFELVVLRPPLIYGPGVKGNFLRLLQLVARRVPLPIGGIRNQRSLLYIGNLVDAIIAALRAAQSSLGTYLVSDGEDVSTPELVRLLARAFGFEARMLSVPVSMLDLAARVTGRAAELNRLTQSLRIDASRIRLDLQWRPAHSVRQGLEETARWYHATLVAR